MTPGRRAGAAAAALLLLTVCAALAAHRAITGSLPPLLDAVLLLEHAGLNLLLAWFFGRTLVAGREPLCTRFARMVHESLPPPVVAYTRRITLAWTIFFAVLCALSVGLHAAGFERAWSLFVTIGNPLLLLLMFAGEYVVRMRVLPDWKRVGILGGIRAFSRHASATLERAR